MLVKHFVEFLLVRNKLFHDRRQFVKVPFKIISYALLSTIICHFVGKKVESHEMASLVFILFTVKSLK